MYAEKSGAFSSLDGHFQGENCLAKKSEGRPEQIGITFQTGFGKRGNRPSCVRATGRSPIILLIPYRPNLFPLIFDWLSFVDEDRFETLLHSKSLLKLRRPS